MADDKIPKGRVRRSAKLGSAIGAAGARYAGHQGGERRALEEGGQRRLEQRHLETAMKMVATLGEMKGAAMKMGQLASFVDTEFLPREYAEIYQEQLAQLRTSAPAMPWEKVSRCSRRSTSASRSTSCSPSSSTRPSRPRRSARCTARPSYDGAPSRSRSSIPGIAEALEADLRNAGMIVRLARAFAPGLDAKAVAEELRERVMEELDYEYEAQNQRSFARAYRDHPFIYVPDVLTRLSRRRVLVTEYVEGIGFEEVKGSPQEERDRFGEIVFRVQLRLDLPPAALQRRPPPGQLHPDARRPGRLPRLRDDQAARPRADRARAAGDRRRRRATTRRRSARRSTTSASSRTRRSSTPSG